MPVGLQGRCLHAAGLWYAQTSEERKDSHGSSMRPDARHAHQHLDPLLDPSLLRCQVPLHGSGRDGNHSGAVRILVAGLDRLRIATVSCRSSLASSVSLA